MKKVNTYSDKKLYFWIIFIVLISAINYGLMGSFNINLMKYGLDTIHPSTYRIILIIIGMCGIILINNRDTYLPFLGESVYPCGSLTEHIPNNTTEEVNVRVPPNSFVIYWASEPKNEELKSLNDPWTAYLNYENSGVIKSDDKGNAILKVRKPQSYKVSKFGREKILDSHIHYRYCKGPGMMSKIFTEKL